MRSTLRIIVLTFFKFFSKNSKSVCLGTKENLFKVSKIHTPTPQTSNFSHFNTPVEAQMIKVTFRALVLLFMHGMLRCFDYIENLNSCRSCMGNTSGKYLENLIKNRRCKTTCCFLKSRKQQFLHIF